jgi:oligoribonuclease NrnB/cAMP/cGMP phosphodiesterase (DHH superfamily)
MTTSSDPLNYNNRLVIIHDTDADGTAAAWCINKGFKNEHDTVVYIPQRAGINTIPEGLLPSDSVYMVDRTYPWDMLLQLSKQVFNVTVIDHHKSAMDDYNRVISELTNFTDSMIYTASSLYFNYSNITVSIDTTHSACKLAWLWILEHGTDPTTTISAPWFIDYIEDRDMWWFKLPNSKEINAGMHYHGVGRSGFSSFECYDKWYEQKETKVTRNSEIPFTLFEVDYLGGIALNTQLNIIKSIVHGPTVTYESMIHTAPTDKYGRLTGNGELKFAIVCCPFTLISDLGSYILNYDFEHVPDELLGSTPVREVDAVICYNKITLPTGDKYTYSIRSKQDMLWLAKLHNGGGHPNACGFTSEIPPNLILMMTHLTLQCGSVITHSDNVPSSDSTTVSNVEYDKSEAEIITNPELTRMYSDLPQSYPKGMYNNSARSGMGIPKN